MLQRNHNPNRHAITTIETIVALGLVVTALSATASLMVRHNRLLADGRAYRQAVDELSNHLDRLTGLSATEAQAELDALAGHPPEGPLVDAGITGLIQPLEGSSVPGKRITLTLRWSEPSRRPAVTLSGWMFDPAEEAP